MSPAPAEYGDRCRAAVEAEGLPFLAQLIPPSQGVPDYVHLVREAVKARPAPKTPAAATATPTIVIPDQLRRDDLRFIKVRAGGKDALEKAWPTVANYAHDSPAIALHTANGGNFGAFPASGSRLLIIDADDLARLAELAALEGFPATFTIASGSSSLEAPKRHFYFEIEGEPLEGKRPFFDPATAGPDGHLGDLFAQGATGRGYVVGPGSIHPCGEPYTVLSDLPIATLPREAWDRFAAAVRWSTAPPATGPAQTRTAPRGGSLGDLIGLKVTDVWPIPSDAERSGDEVRFAHPVHGSTTGKNLGYNRQKDLWHCHRCGSGGDALAALAVDEGIIDCSEAGPGALNDPDAMRRVVDAAAARGFDVERAEQQRRATAAPARVKAPKTTAAPAPAAPAPAAPPAAETLAPFTYRHHKWGICVKVEAVAEAVYDKFSVVAFNKTLYIYRNGFYLENKGEIEAEIKTILATTGTNEQLTRITREVLAHLEATAPYRDYPFNRAPDLIPVVNGVLRIDYETGRPELLPHSPGYRFNYQLPVTFDPDADPGPIREVFAEYVDPDVVDVLYEIPAVALLQMHGTKPFKRSYLLQGDTNAAKTTYLEIIGRLIGIANISSASLQDLTGDRFIKGDLEGRILNIYDELKSIPLKDVGAFKALTGGFKHRIERKHANAYEGHITAVHVFSCNEPPGYPDEVEYDSAWWSRWEYLNFTNVFEVDRTFLDRVLTPANLSGLLNGVIAAMVHIHAHGLYREPDPGRVKDSWKIASDWFKEFIDAEMVPTTGGAVTDFDKGKLLLSFRRWCEDKEKPPKKIPQSAKTFAPMVFRNRFFPRQVGREKTWVYSGAYRFREGSAYENPFA